MFFHKLSLASRSGPLSSALCALAHAMRLPCVTEKNLSLAYNILSSLPHSHLTRRFWSTSGNTDSTATGSPRVWPLRCHLHSFEAAVKCEIGWVTPSAAPASHRPQQDGATSLPGCYVTFPLPIFVAGVYKKPVWGDPCYKAIFSPCCLCAVFSSH